MLSQDKTQENQHKISQYKDNLHSKLFAKSCCKTGD